MEPLKALLSNGSLFVYCRGLVDLKFIFGTRQW